MATIVTYVGNRYWTFSHRQGQGNTRDTVVFFILNGVGLLIYYACLWFRDLAGLDGKLWYNVALIVGTGLGTLFRFWSYRKWVWVAVAEQPPAVTGRSRSRCWPRNSRGPPRSSAAGRRQPTPRRASALPPRTAGPRASHRRT